MHKSLNVKCLYVSEPNDVINSEFLYSATTLRTAQNAFILYFPGKPVKSDTISTSLGSIQPYATINVQRLLVHISTSVYSQVLIYIAE